MLVSILITSYNYGRYLAAAIDSALSQTYREIEVIIVDDGSTDDSQAIIASYGERVISVFKQNGGPTSALNQAFERSRGELICFLDADDVFEATKVQSVVEAVSRLPSAYLVHHQMQMIDADGKPIHAPFPRHVSSGDLRHRVIQTGGWFSHAVLSGLAFRRSYLERLFPIPHTWDVQTATAFHRMQIGADTYLAGPAALLAPVVGIGQPLTRYRTHESNLSSRFFAVPALQMVRYAAEMQALSTVMREKFGQSVELQMDHHFEYQLLRCAVGDVSRVRTVAHVLRSAALPLSLRCREALRVCANRGIARRS